MTVMNDQCLNCKIRKWCYRENPSKEGSETDAKI